MNIRLKVSLRGHEPLWVVGPVGVASFCRCLKRTNFLLTRKAVDTVKINRGYSLHTKFNLQRLRWGLNIVVRLRLRVPSNEFLRSSFPSKLTSIANH